MHGENLKLEIK